MDKYDSLEGYNDMELENYDRMNELDSSSF